MQKTQYLVLLLLSLLISRVAAESVVEDTFCAPFATAHKQAQEMRQAGNSQSTIRSFYFVSAKKHMSVEQATTYASIVDFVFNYYTTTEDASMIRVIEYDACLTARNK